MESLPVAADAWLDEIVLHLFALESCTVAVEIVRNKREVGADECRFASDEVVVASDDLVVTSEELVLGRTRS
ncbi:hypothetical protein [Polyangium spumosum]|uniref:Uncharacterized protein n=1 Tax=Polyangium spumosum TaxID=889282 RepID=A0A6N7PJ50_9BACT|nr:hypothetical protein [Polyangium spumosum]MRG92113.1 hypothetical protein [Polyangium spumosum]